MINTKQLGFTKFKNMFNSLSLNHMINLAPSFISFNLEDEFKRIAGDLISGYSLKSAKHTYYFAEIEFYLYHTDHPDLATHGSDHQLHYGQWYFHRYKNGNNKVGNRKGLDITFGNKEIICHAGILIRALQNSKNDKDYIYGPSKVVDRVLEDSVSYELDIEKTNIFQNKILSIIQGGTDREIFACPRHNLGKNTPEVYLKKHYRFFSYANKVHYGKEKVIIPCLKERGIDREIIKREFCRKTI